MGVLDGFRVLDLTRGMAGAVAGMILVDQGAEVVKVEPPGGDPFADLPANRVWDRAKRSVALDLRTEEGRDDFFTLVATADAVIEGMRPGAADALGVGYEVLHARSPSLVYISLTAYGDAGPRRDRPGYDALVSARMGIHATQAGTRAGRASTPRRWRPTALRCSRSSAL
jgi:crotonobetainyl-CoA:carnitine CoA-transferase CaiB-like acyl-CoA transferase